MNLFQLIALSLVCFVFSCCGSSTKASSSGGQESAKYEMLNNYTLRLTDISSDDSYGYTEGNAIKVNATTSSDGPTNEQRYLNALLGPNGEAVSYVRQGSCCPVKSKNAVIGNHVYLDKYQVTYEGLAKPVILYLNMYDRGPVKAPKGFTFKQ